MQLKRRLDALENQAVRSDPLVVLVSTFYENVDGEIEYRTRSASIIFGQGNCLYLSKKGGESEIAFLDRVDNQKISREQGRA